MLTVLSPAKKLSKECSVHTEKYELPRFLDKSDELVKTLKGMDPNDLMSLMGISENLAVLNWERIQNWDKSFKFPYIYNFFKALNNFRILRGLGKLLIKLIKVFSLMK